MKQVRYLLLQVRNTDDPMRAQEPSCFARALHADSTQIRTFDLLDQELQSDDLNGIDVVLIGGSGHYSATDDAPWLYRSLRSLRFLYETGIPTFASCWGFQAFARAMGGQVVHDLDHAEIGTVELKLTEEGKRDPVFSQLHEPIFAQMGHEDYVTRLPENAILLVSSSLVQNEAYRFCDRPIYCTQFHPELSAGDLITRARNYPEYVEKIARMPEAEFEKTVRSTPDTESLMLSFVRMALGI